MSEKHLSELGWTALAVKNKIKDKDLQKELARFKTYKETAFSQKLGCLEEIEDLATKLQKENKDNKEIVSYLKELLMEVAKTSKAVDLERKQADKEAGLEEDDEDSGLNFKDKLIAELKKAKMRKPTDPPGEALLCKAGSEFAILFAKKVGTTQKNHLSELLKDRGQMKFIKGVCEYNPKVGYTVVLQSLPTGATKAVKLFLKEQTGINYKMLVIGPRKGAGKDDDAEEDIRGAKPDLSPRFNNRFAALLPKIKLAIAAGGPAAQNLKLAASQAGMFARKQDFAQANRFLDTAEALLKKGQGNGPASPAGKTNVNVAPFRKQWGPARQAWRDASDLVDSQITKLQSVLKNSADEELKRIADSGLNGITGNFKTPLMAVMMELDKADNDETLARSANRARTIFKGFRKHVDSNENVKACDTNPFGVKMSIRETIGKGLGKLEETLSAAV